MSERRYDPTTGEWVVFATHREDRTYHPPRGACPLCPTLPGGPQTEINRPSYEIVVFDNRFPAYVPEPPQPAVAGTPLTPVAPARGHCEVVVYTDQHDLTLAEVGVARIRLLIEVWAERTRELGADPAVSYVMPFENKGEVIGVTLSHPHGQIYAFPDIPPRPLRELNAARLHHDARGTCVWCDVVAQETISGERLVVEGSHVVAAVPFWARWPYQVHIWTRRHVTDLVDLGPDERQDLAQVLAQVLVAYDHLFDTSLPYILTVHQRPSVVGWDDVSHLYIELNPPNRSADKIKFLAGCETGAGTYITDVAPEVAAAQLRVALGRADVPAVPGRPAGRP